MDFWAFKNERFKEGGIEGDIVKGRGALEVKSISIGWLMVVEIGNS